MTRQGGDSGGTVIRESRPADLPALEALYPAAFPEEDLLPLVRDLLRQEAGVLSLVAAAGGVPVGHVVFTRGDLAGAPGVVALLGPLAVAPDRQGRGIAGDLVREGLRRLRADGVRQVNVLGDPAYYGRFGFAPDRTVLPPCPLPEDWSEAWQRLSLGDGGPLPGGRLELPPPWRNPALWQP